MRTRQSHLMIALRNSKKKTLDSRHKSKSVSLRSFSSACMQGSRTFQELEEQAQADADMAGAHFRDLEIALEEAQETLAASKTEFAQRLHVRAWRFLLLALHAVCFCLCPFAFFLIFFLVFVSVFPCLY